MRTHIGNWASALTIALLSTLFLTSCEEEEIIIPNVNTFVLTEITDKTATCGGDVFLDGGAAVIARGVCWSTHQTPSIADNKTMDGTGLGTFTSLLSNLTSNTCYYVRAYATNSKGTAYGSVQSFTTENTLIYDSFTDPRDGNVYKTITIGTQVWMAENLKYLPSVVGVGTSELTPYYYVYEYNGTNVNEAQATAEYTTYGVLYNWTAACTSCPEGWHLPSDAEWTQLTDYLGGINVAGGKLKEKGTMLWESPNQDASDEVGFTALPGGYRDITGAFYSNGSIGYWWSSSELHVDNAYFRYLNYNTELVYRTFFNKANGFSVRCVKD